MWNLIYVVAALTTLPRLYAVTARPQAIDTTEVMAGLVAELRTEHPGLRVVMNENNAEHCGPECGASGDTGGQLPRDVARVLLRRRLIEATCRRTPRHFTCGPPGWMYVGLSLIHEAPHGMFDRKGVWVQATVRIPCERCRPDLIGTWYRLDKDPEGKWTVRERLPAFVF